MFENPINKLRFWCHKVIPLVYDEALSYYEVICKVAKKINEVIDDVNGLHDTVVFSINGNTPTDGNVELDASSFSGSVVCSVNGVLPNDEGELTLDADDVGALPNSIDPVESVNGLSPDSNGNVNVGTVKSVNSQLPDADGNINLPTVAGVTSVNGNGPDSSGNVTVFPLSSAYDASENWNSLNDLVAFVRNTSNNKKIYQLTKNNYLTVDGFAPPGTALDDICVYTFYCLGESGDSYVQCWNSTKKILCIAANTMPVNNVLNATWVKIYNGTAETISNIATPETGIHIDSSIGVKYNNIMYARVLGYAETAHTSGEAPLFTLSPPPAFQNWAILRKDDGSCIMVNILPSGRVEQMWHGSLAQGDYFTLVYSYPY